MTLRKLRAAHPDLFYGQEWFDGEPFMDEEPSEWVDMIPVPQLTLLEVDGFTRPMVRAVDLATIYVRHPGWDVWRHFLWTDDVDRHGNRVYVAGLGQYGCEGFQIHRKLEPVAYWVGLPA